MAGPLRVLLFDVDHTLLSAGGAGFRAMDRAFVELYGVENATRGIAPDGKTDPMLFGEAPVGCRTGGRGGPPRELKAAPFGLARSFAFGAYGSDHGARLRLPPIAVERAERLAGRPIGLGPHVALVGDTPRGVVC